MAIKFKRTIGRVGGETGSLMITIPPELASILKIDKGTSVEIWYDEEKKTISIGVIDVKK